MFFTSGVDCSDERVDAQSTVNKLLNAEMNFVTTGQEVQDPTKDLPWRFRNLNSDIRTRRRVHR